MIVWLWHVEARNWAPARCFHNGGSNLMVFAGSGGGSIGWVLS